MMMAVAKKHESAEEEPKAEERETYRYVGNAQVVLVMVEGVAYELQPDVNVSLPKSAEGLDEHSDFVKVK
jgi:hypothetical protein